MVIKEDLFSKMAKDGVGGNNNPSDIDRMVNTFSVGRRSTTIILVVLARNPPIDCWIDHKC